MSLVVPRVAPGVTSSIARMVKVRRLAGSKTYEMPCVLSLLFQARDLHSDLPNISRSRSMEGMSAN